MALALPAFRQAFAGASALGRGRDRGRRMSGCGRRCGNWGICCGSKQVDGGGEVTGMNSARPLAGRGGREGKTRPSESQFR